jgi:4-hydroxy-tetrahydrodipicolinate synthase
LTHKIEIGNHDLKRIISMLKGSIVALITPFNEDGSVDLKTIEKLVDWHIQQKTDAIVCCGTTGESSTLSDEEHMAIFKTAVKTAKKRTVVIAGTGTNDTAHTVKRTKEALKCGVDMALVVLPYYNKPTFEGCYAHFEEVGKVGLDTIVYYHPGRTGLRLKAQELATICDLKSMVALKDASGSMDFIDEFKRYTSKAVYSGDDLLALDHLTRGAQGVISVVANLYPFAWRQMIHACLEGRTKEAEKIFLQLAPLCKAIFLENNPQGVKYAAYQQKQCLLKLRLPLVPPRKETQEAIDEAIKNYPMLALPQELYSTAQ